MKRLITIAALLMAGAATPALAQNAAIETRLNKVEKELRAVQRKVFPGANQEFFEPEITAPATTAAPGGIPASSAVNDLSQRVGALETEVQRLTAQTEENGFKIRQLQQAFDRYKADVDGRLSVIGGVTAQPLVPPAGESAGSALPPTIAAPPAPVASAPAQPAPAPAPAAAPSTGDPGEDAYMAGYRLWEAKRFGDAQTALKDVVAKYPNHKRASFAQNLLGRAYLDEGKPGLAAEAFYANYQKMPRGERAPDSLYYLGQSLMQLKKPQEACKVYGELTDVYGQKINEALRARVAKGQVDAKCSL